MSTQAVIGLMFLGWLIGWLLKYVIFGLENWDRWLHPERLCGDTTGPYSQFSKPFLGAFQ